MSKGALMGLRRGFDVLKLLSCEMDGMSFSGIQDALGDLPAPTLSRLLKAMTEEGWLEKGPSGEYLPGNEFLKVCKRVSGGASMEDILEPIVVKLAECAGETSAFSIFADNCFIFKLKHEMPDSYHHIELNRKSSAIFSNGIGISNLAFQDEATIAYALKDAPDSVDLAAFKETLKEIRREEYYFSDERNGLRFLKPVFGKGGKFVGIIGVSRIDREISEEKKEHYKALVEKFAAKAAEALNRDI